MTSTTSTTTPTSLRAESLRGLCDGGVHLPGDPGYDAARLPWNAALDQRPAAVAQPRTVAQVQQVVRAAAAADLRVAPQSTGHNAGPLVAQGLDDVVVLRTSAMTGVTIDPVRRIARVEGGALWMHATEPAGDHGLAALHGSSPDVGIAGYSLGGGIGWYARRLGLATNSLTAVELVTADGEHLRADSHRNAELFWALRGGGGNFGVVVDFDFLAQPVGTVHFGTVAYRLDDPAALVTRWRDVMRVAPDELSSTLALPPRIPGVPPSATVLLCYAGAPGSTVTEADAAIEPLLELGTVTAATISERRYGEILEDAAPPPQLRLVARNTLVSNLDDAVIAAITRLHATSVPTAVAVRSLGGAFGRVPSDATAFAHRDAEAMIVALLMLPDTAADPEIERALLPWRAVAARGTGTYINFQGSATAADLAAAYPPATYARLTAVKRAYDPGNRFALNHNIEPARQGGPKAAA
jgi:FAD/FMN-containing dehydrogenase